MYPTHPKANLENVLQPKGLEQGFLQQLNADDVARAKSIRELAEEDSVVGEMLRTARNLEGSVRNTGIHACGVIITPDDIRKIIPITTAKDSELLVTQFDNAVVEDAGLLKMDFLGLKTLSIIKDAIRIIGKIHGVKIDPDDIPLDDELTYERIFQKGRTVGIFQYESAGMQKNLKLLAPNKFEDLIAMNALYRPGPMQYIPLFIDRRHGREEITYDLEDMKEYLDSTYGITVYQEQVMLLSQKLAGFTRGEADILRKGMGKKKKKIIDALYPKFLEGGKARGHDPKILQKIWKDWEAFASYAFNKSHSTCYAYVAYQTAYLKANFPAEFMASTLTHNKNDITKLNSLLRECKRMNLRVLSPDVNESGHNFTVTSSGYIRIGMTALKGVGEGPVDAIIDERRSKGKFSSLLDLTQRVAGKSINKKCFEALIYAGGFDSFGINRAQYFASSGEYDSYFEHVLKLGQRMHQEKSQSQFSLFGAQEIMDIAEPPIPEAEEWNDFFKLEKEKEVVGIYVSGHPLDTYQFELNSFVNISLDRVESITSPGKLLKVGGIVTAASHGQNKNGNGFCRLKLQDFKGELELFVSNEMYYNHKGLLETGQLLYLELECKKRFHNDSVFLDVKNIFLLSSVAKRFLKGIKLRISVDQLNDKFLTDVYTLVNQQKGEHQLKLQLVDVEEKLDVELNSGKINVDVNSSFVEELDRLGITYKVN